MMGIFIILITNNNANPSEVQEEARCLMWPGQGLQMPEGPFISSGW